MLFTFFYTYTQINFEPTIITLLNTLFKSIYYLVKSTFAFLQAYWSIIICFNKLMHNIALFDTKVFLNIVITPILALTCLVHTISIAIFLAFLHTVFLTYWIIFVFVPITPSNANTICIEAIGVWFVNTIITFFHTHQRFP